MNPRTIVAVLESLSVAKDGALTNALSLADWYDSELHVVHLGGSARRGKSAVDAIRGELANRVSRVAESSKLGDVNVIPEVLWGPPIEASAAFADHVAADLVVVGKGVRRGSYWSAGSFAAALGRAVKPPTIAIPRGHSRAADSGGLFRRILVAVDFSDVSRRASSEALLFAQQSGGHLRLMHVLDGLPYETVYSGSRAARVIEDFRARVARVDTDLRSLIPPDASNWSEIDVTTVAGVADEAILETASEWRADLVVLGLPRRSRLDDFVEGSTVHGVLRRASSPVLLVPGPATVVEHASSNTSELRVEV